MYTSGTCQRCQYLYIDISQALLFDKDVVGLYYYYYFIFCIKSVDGLVSTKTYPGDNRSDFALILFYFLKFLIFFMILHNHNFIIHDFLCRAYRVVFIRSKYRNFVDVVRVKRNGGLFT